MLNVFRLNSGLDGRAELALGHVSSDDEREEGQLVILNSKGGTYKLRDSRFVYVVGV